MILSGMCQNWKEKKILVQKVLDFGKIFCLLFRVEKEFWFCYFTSKFAYSDEFG